MQNYILDYSKSGKQPNIRELTLLNGISYPDDEELIMLILGKGTKNNPIESLAEKVTKTINSSNEEELIPNLKKINGMGESRALIIAAALELGRRRRGILRSSINAPKDVIPFLQHYTLMPTEHFITVTVNGAKVDIPSYICSVGDVITLKESSKELKVVKEALESLLIVAPYLELDKEKMVGKYTRIPERNELNKEITESQIVEFYNRKL